MKILLSLALVTLWTGDLLGQVSYQRILNADREPGNWLTYSRTYNSQRYSHLDQIRKANVKNLELKWVYQAKSLENFEATPLVVDGVMYLTRPPNVVVALDARTGRVFWTYHHKVPKEVSVCCGLVNRGLAILDDLLFLGTLDARLQAIDAKTGSLVWDVKLADFRDGYAVTMAPLAIKDKVIVGMGWRRVRHSRFPGGPMKPRPAREPGAFTPFRAPANRGTRPGRETPGKPAEARPG